MTNPGDAAQVAGEGEASEASENNRAVARWQAGEPEQAKRIFDAWLSTHPTALYPWINRQLLALAQGETSLPAVAMAWQRQLTPVHPAAIDDPQVAAFLAQLAGVTLALDEAATALTVSLDGKWLFIGDQVGAVSLYDLQEGALTCVLRSSPLLDRSPVQAMVHRADTQELVVCHQSGMIRVWDLATRLPLFAMEGPGCAAALANRPAVGEPAGERAPRSATRPVVIEVGMQISGSSLSAALSQDGQRALFGWLAGMPTLWEVRSGRALRTLAAPAAASAVALSADGSRALTGHQEKSVILWDAHSGAQLATFARHGSAVTALALRADGALAAIASWDRSLWLWDIASGQARCLSSGHSEPISTLSFSASTQKLLSGSKDHSLRVWDVESGRCLRILSGHRDAIGAALLHPADELPISGSSDKTLFLWKEAGSGCAPLVHRTIESSVRQKRQVLLQRLADLDLSAHQELRELCAQNSEYQRDSEILNALHEAGRRAGLLTGVRGMFRTLAMESRHEPRALATAGMQPLGAVADARGNLSLIDLERGELKERLAGESMAALSLAYSPDGAYLAVGGTDRSARLYQSSTGQLVATLEHRHPIGVIGFSSDGKLLVTGTKEEAVIRIWDLASRELLCTSAAVSSALASIAFSADGSLLLVQDQSNLALWETASLKPLRLLVEHSYSTLAAVFSPDGRSVLAVIRSRDAEWYDTASGRPLAKSKVGDLRAAAVSPDRRLLAGVGDDKKLKLWELGSGRLLYELDVSPERVSGLSFSGDGQYLLLHSYGQVQCFRMQSEWALLEELLPEAEQVLGAAWPLAAPPRLWPYLQQGAPLDAHLEIWRTLQKAAVRSDVAPELQARYAALRAALPELLVRDVLQHSSPFGRTAAPPNELRRRLGHPVHRASQVDAALAAELLQALHSSQRSSARRAAAAPLAVDAAAEEQVALTPLPSFAALFAQLEGQGSSALQGVLTSAAQHAAAADGETAWGAFLCRNAAVISGGGADALLQRALAEHPGSVVLAMGQDFVRANSPRRAWLRSLRPLGPEPGRGGQRTILQHKDGIRAALAHPDGRRAVVAVGNDIQIIDLGSGLLTAKLQGHTGAVTALGISADGRTLVSAAYDGVLRIWDLRKNAHVRTLAENVKSVQQIVITADGEQLILGGENGALKSWELSSGALRHSFVGHTNTVTWVALHPDGELLLSGGWDRATRVWDLGSGQCVHTLTGDLGCADPLALFADGVRVLYINYSNFGCWDLATADVVRRYRTEGNDSPRGPWLIHPDQKRMVAAHRDAAIGVWDLATGKCEKRLSGHSKNLTALTLLPDGRHVLSAGDDGSVRLWDLEAVSQAPADDRHQQAVSALATLGSARRIVSAAEDQTLRLWDGESGRSERGLRIAEGESAQLGSGSLQNSGAREILLHPDGRRAITRSESSVILIWDLQTGKCIRALSGHTRRVSALALHPDGWRLISGSDDGALRVWSLDTGVCATVLSEQNAEVSSLLLLPDGDRLAAGYSDGCIRVWELAQKQVALRLVRHSDRVLALWLDQHAGSLVSVDEGENLIRWELLNGQAVDGCHGEDRVLKPLPDGERYVCSKYDGEVSIVRIRDAQPLRKLKGHGERVKAVALHPRRPLLLSAAPDRTARLWDLPSGELVAVWYSDSALTTCAIDDEGLLILGDATGQVTILELCMPADAQPAVLPELTLRCQSAEHEEALRALAGAVDDADTGWQALSTALRDRREGVLWLGDAAPANHAALLAAAAVRQAPTSHGPELRVYCRFQPRAEVLCRQSFLQLADAALRSFAGIAKADPAPGSPPELLSGEHLERAVQSALARIVSGRVLFILDGMEVVAEQDPWFVSELVAELSDARVLWLCAGRNTAALQAALQPLRASAVFSGEPSAVAAPEPAEGDIAELLRAGQVEQALARITSFAEWMQRLGSGGDACQRLALALRQVSAAAPAAPALAAWVEFLRQHRVLLSQDGATALLQLAMADADGSPITQAAEAWLQTAQWDKPWLRRLHRPAQPEPHRTLLSGHKRWIRSMSLDAEGRRLISCAGDEPKVRVWDLESGRCAQSLVVPDARAMLFGSEPQRLLGVQKCLGEWDLLSTSCLRRCRPTLTTTVAVEPQLRWAATVDWRQIELWDVAKLERMRAIEGISGRIEVAVAHPDGRRLLTVAEDRKVRCWDVEAGTCQQVSEAFPSAVRGLFIHPDQQRVLVACDAALAIWELATGTTLALHKMDLPYRPRLCVRADGRELLSVQQHYVRVLDLATGELRDSWLMGSEPIREMILHPDGARLITGHDDGTIWVTDVSQPRTPRPGHLGGATAMAVDERESALLTISADRLVRWELLSGGQRESLALPAERPRVRLLSAEHKLAVAVAANHAVEVWDLELTARRHSLEGHSKPPRELAFGGSGRRLVSLGADGLRVWDLESGACLQTWDSPPEAVQKANHIALLPDEQRILVLESKSPTQIWDLETRTCVATLEEMSGIYTCALDPQAQRLVAVTVRGKVQVWELETQRLLASWKPPRHPSHYALTSTGLVVLADAAGELTYLQLSE